MLGQPIAHSRSPAIQSAALRELGMAPQWSYEAIEVSAEQFGPTVKALPEQGFVGANVTVPHKRRALELADQRSEVAREIGAANTLSFADTRMRADNTDAAGLMAAIGRSLASRRALVLGAGGAARAVVWALVREGARVEVWNRTAERAAALCAELGGRPSERPQGGDYEVIVNATAVGLAGEDQLTSLPLVASSFRAGQLVVDLVYGEAETSLVRAARGGGAEVIDGLEVLVCQGAASFLLWTGREPPLEAMRAAARAGEA